jgi:signal peptidase II
MSSAARPSPAKARALGFAVAALALALDQASKWAMVGPLDLPRIEQITLLPIFNFTWAENYGVSLGLFTAGSEGGRWALIAMTSAIALGVLIWLLRERHSGETFALGLVLGGALGNIYDRATHGFVVDFLDLHFGLYRPFLIFNLADVAITLGVLIILARSFLSRNKAGQNPDAPSASTEEIHNA